MTCDLHMTERLCGSSLRPTEHMTETESFTTASPPSNHFSLSVSAGDRLLLMGTGEAS